MTDCCRYKTNKKGICKRNDDKKLFDMPRKYSIEQCNSIPIKGFTMRASCAPFIGCDNKYKSKNIKQNGGGVGV